MHQNCAKKGVTLSDRPVSYPVNAIGHATGLAGTVHVAEQMRSSAVWSNTFPCWINRAAVPAAGQNFPKGCNGIYGFWAHTKWIRNEKLASRQESSDLPHSAQSLFIRPNPATYPLSIVSECAVTRPELRIAPADSSLSTWRQGSADLPSPRPILQISKICFAGDARLVDGRVQRWLHRRR